MYRYTRNTTFSCILYRVPNYNQYILQCASLGILERLNAARRPDDAQLVGPILYWPKWL